jgi:hypothetical protein
MEFRQTLKKYKISGFNDGENMHTFSTLKMEAMRASEMLVGT